MAEFAFTSMCDIFSVSQSRELMKDVISIQYNIELGFRQAMVLKVKLTALESVLGVALGL